MADPVTRQPLLTVEEYLRLEDASATKHEYVAGEVHALAGTTRRHNRIAGNIYARLLTAARGGPCRVYIGDVKLRAAQNIVYYPDLIVACGPPGADPLFADDPCVVVEVLSPSTQAIDRREKALVYKSIESLRAYLIVHQDGQRVERHYRGDDGQWWYADTARQGYVPVPCPEVRLTLGEIYEGVEREGASGE